jgi:anaerobic dimethyl sulfoxide reductase subunit B (iron-sulfur subunit)
MHCIDPECIKACPEEAIEKHSDGIVVVDIERCTGCEMCLEVCPFGIPQFGSDGKMQKCDMCINEIDYKTETPPCVNTCPTTALQFGPMSTDEKMAFEKSIREKF